MASKEKLYKAQALTGFRQMLDGLQKEMESKGFKDAVPSDAVITAIVKEFGADGINALDAIRHKSIYEGFQLAVAAFMTFKEKMLGPEAKVNIE